MCKRLLFEKSNISLIPPKNFSHYIKQRLKLKNIGIQRHRVQGAAVAFGTNGVRVRWLRAQREVD